MGTMTRLSRRITKTMPFWNLLTCCAVSECIWRVSKTNILQITLRVCKQVRLDCSLNHASQMRWILAQFSISELIFHVLYLVITLTNLMSMERYTFELFGGTTCFWICSIKYKVSLADCHLQCLSEKFKKKRKRYCANDVNFSQGKTLYQRRNEC